MAEGRKAWLPALLLEREMFLPADSDLVSYSMKPGRVVILLAGRHAGKKAIIVKQNDDGKKVNLRIPYSL
jgi:hypothetical protein